MFHIYQASLKIVVREAQKKFLEPSQEKISNWMENENSIFLAFYINRMKG